jgi:hypothetical protein
MGDRLGGWGDVARGGVRLYSLPFSPRGSLNEPFVGYLAELMRGCIDRAMENPRANSDDEEMDLSATAGVL